MKLRQIVKELSSVLPVEAIGSLDRDVSGVVYDSRAVSPGKLFVAMRGAETDGHSFIASAIDRGAVGVVCENRTGGSSKATRIVVPDSRLALAHIANIFYGYPTRKLRMIGVTGTNGKTTVTFLLKRILMEAKLNTGLLGTVRYEIGDRIIPALRTTPESLDLQSLLAKLVQMDGKCCVMEVSSHALAQSRVAGIDYDMGIFTNLTRDHLDFHKSMNAYFDCKRRLFEAGQKRGKKFTAVVNVDDEYGKKLVEGLTGCKLVTYGLGDYNGKMPDVTATDIRLSSKGTTMRVWVSGADFELSMPLIGRFNVMNVLAAIGASVAMGVDTKVIVPALEKMSVVSGRLEPIKAGQAFDVLVDYAHTDDALRNVLSTLQEVTRGRLLVVFGCGGSRDTGKRFKMGEVAAKLAGYSVITTDNPRREDPAAIAKQIVEGFCSVRKDGYEVELNRSLAIERIIRMAEPGDTVVLCGKGHEVYQEFNGVSIPFDDRIHAMGVLRSLGYGGK